MRCEAHITWLPITSVIPLLQPRGLLLLLLHAPCDPASGPLHCLLSPRYLQCAHFLTSFSGLSPSRCGLSRLPCLKWQSPSPPPSARSYHLPLLSLTRTSVDTLYVCVCFLAPTLGCKLHNKLPSGSSHPSTGWKKRGSLVHCWVPSTWNCPAWHQAGPR